MKIDLTLFFNVTICPNIYRFPAFKVSPENDFVNVVLSCWKELNSFRVALLEQGVGADDLSEVPFNPNHRESVTQFSCCLREDAPVPERAAT